ncbi:MAG: hypothetical protein IKN45_05145 [Lachnospiraceae bacterium]|nr:hypothetical protein [Lachnospiraceae bacterium]
MFVVYPDNLRNNAEKVQEEIRLRNEAYEKLQRSCNALSNMSSMDEQVNRFRQLLKGLENQISALCRMHSLMEEIRYRYEKEERKVVNDAEGVREENESIIRRQHIRHVAVPSGIQIVRRL